MKLNFNSTRREIIKLQKKWSDEKTKNNKKKKRERERDHCVVLLESYIHSKIRRDLVLCF